MQRIGGRGRQRDLRIARHVDRPPGARAVGDAHAPQLDVVFRRDDDLHVRLEVAVAAAELRARFREDRLVLFRRLARRLVRRRPEDAARRVADVAERAPGVARGVFAPARDGDVLPAAVAAARVGDHHVIAAIRQELHFRDRRVGGRQHAHRRFGARDEAAGQRQFRELRMERRGLRNALLQQQQRGLELRIGLEALLHRTREQHVGERQQDHPLVMRHERSHDDGALPARHPRRRVVDRFEETEAAGEAVAGQPLQVEAGRFGRDHQRERGCIGRHDQVLREPALQAQSGNAERAILVIQTRIDGVVAALRDSPGNAALPAVRDLPVHRRAAGLVQQRVLVRRHHEERHQVLEHRAAPRQQHRLPSGGREQAPQREPVFLRQPPLRDRDEAGKARLGRQQVVIARVPPALADVVADRQQVPRRVVEEVVFHAGEFLAIAGQPVDLGQAHGGETARIRQRRGDLRVRRGIRRCRAGAAVDAAHAQRFVAERSKFAQRRYRARIESAGTRVRRVLRHAPRRERREFVAQRLHLRNERARPERGIGRR